jgi:hypothetical protein
LVLPNEFKLNGDPLSASQVSALGPSSVNNNNKKRWFMRQLFISFGFLELGSLKRASTGAVTPGGNQYKPASGDILSKALIVVAKSMH